MELQQTLEQNFYRGELDSLTALNSEEAHAAGVLHLCIWSHSLSGRLERALWHKNWIEHEGCTLAEDEWATIHFALGVAYTRVSDYGKARTSFARIRRFACRDAKARFFLYQALGFYRYFCGHFDRSSRYALRALEESTQLHFAFGQLLAEELLAHALIEQGRIRLGLSHLKAALDKAQALDHRLLAKSFRLNFLLYRARYAYASDMPAKIESALVQLHPQDSYSRTSLMLQLANQYMLRGRVRKAYEVLDGASEEIYANRNRRQIALLNFSLAFITWLRGGRDQALHLLRSAELHLHPDVDLALGAKMRGLKNRILGQPLNRIRGRERQLGIHSRIVSRDVKGAPIAKTYGEDKIGDLMDRIHNKDPEALNEVIKQGLYYLLYDFYDLRFDQKALLFDVAPKGLIVIDQGDIWIIQHGVNHTTRRLLECLASSHQTKDSLIRHVWKYKYEPHRHDSLIYSTVSKLRSSLGAAGAWIESDDSGYRLRSGVQLQTRNPVESVPTHKKTVHLVPTAESENLSFRQLRILNQFDSFKHEALGVDDVVKIFAISRATATRDLSALHRLKYLRRMGRARATRYLRTAKGGLVL